MDNDQMEKKFTWVLKKFSSLQQERLFSRTFSVAGCKWYITANRKKDKNDGHLSLYLELADPESLPQGWRRDVKFSLTLVTKSCGKSNLVMGAKCCFDATAHKGWGYNQFVSLTKLCTKDEGFLVNNKLIILAQVYVFPPPEETLKVVIEPPSSKETDDAIVGKPQGDSTCQDENASKENFDDEEEEEEGTGKDGSDDGSWEEVVDNDEASSSSVSDICLLNKSNASEDVLDTKHGSVSAERPETEVSNGDHDDAPKEDDDSSRDASSLNQVKSVEDVENGGKGFNNVASFTETSCKSLNEIQPIKQTLVVNGFEVCSDQVESVSYIFKRHPEIALGFTRKNQQIRRGYMDALLSLIETICKSPENLTEDDLSNAEDTLTDLISAGFKLDWLKTKLNEVSEKKKKEQGSEARLQTMEEELKKLKLMFLDLETQLQKEKTEALAAKAPLSFNDVVF